MKPSFSSVKLGTRESLPAPVVASSWICCEQISFIDFITDPESGAYLKSVTGNDTAAAELLKGLRKAVRHHYFGVYVRPRRRVPEKLGLLTKAVSPKRTALRKYVAKAHHGGFQFWARTAALLWNAYEHIMRLRERAAKIHRQEMHRLANAGRRREQKRLAQIERRKRGSSHG